MSLKDYSKLKGRTKEKGYTQKDVALSAGISEATYSLKLNGKSAFRQEEISAIIKLLEISPKEIGDYFFQGQGLENTNNIHNRVRITPLPHLPHIP